MNNRTLEEAFNAVFHNKENFADFCSFDWRNDIAEFQQRSRKIYKTSTRVRSYLRFIDKVALRYLALNRNVVHSYVKEKSALTAVAAHVGNRGFFQTDIKAFFSQIVEADVNRILVRDKSLVPISDFDKYIEPVAMITTWGGSIPVGFPTSPKLSNAYLFEFDNALNDFCIANSFVYTRYSDDIIISAKEKALLYNLSRKVEDLLHQHASKELILNAEKTRVTHTGNKVKILGLVVTQDGKVTVDSKYKASVESLLHFYINDKEKYADLLSKTFEAKDASKEENERSLFGLLHYINAIDPEYLEKLQRKYGLLVLHTLMENRWSDD